MSVLTPGEDRYEARMLFKSSRHSTVTMLLERSTERQVVGRLLHVPGPAREVALLEGIQEQVALWRRLDARYVPAVDKIVEGEGGTWILSEYKAGVSLSQYQGMELQVPDVWMLWWFYELLGALESLHAAQPPYYVGHIEPDDVVVDRDILYLVDLALRERIFPEMGALGRTTCEEFTAPEQRQSSQLSAAADVYCAGAMAFWLATGFAPRVEDSASSPRMMEAVRHFRPTLPKEVTDLIGATLEFYPASRPVSAQVARLRLAPFVTRTRGRNLPEVKSHPQHKFAANATRVEVEPKRIRMDSIATPAPASVTQPAHGRRPPLAMLASGLAVAAVLGLVHWRWPTRAPQPVLQGTVQQAEPDVGWKDTTQLGPGVLRTSQDTVLQLGQSTIRLGPGAWFSAPQWDGTQYCLPLRRGGAQAQVASGTLELALPGGNRVDIDAGSEVSVDLATRRVACSRGQAVLVWHGSRYALPSGSYLTMNLR